jgi:vitamin B12 transporter
LNGKFAARKASKCLFPSLSFAMHLNASNRLAAALCFASIAGAQTTSSRLDTVTVVASRAKPGDASRSVEVITRADIDHSTARTIADLLSERIGIDVNGRSAAQADISLRGSTSEQTLILVDGVRVSDLQSSHYALDLAIPLNAIARVEILRGGASALYGPDAVGGVINIVTRGDTRSLEAHTRGGAFGTFGGGLAAGTAHGTNALSGALEYEKSDGYRAGTDYRIGQARITARTSLGDGILESHIGGGLRDFGANAFYGPYNSTERTGSITADSRWTAKADDWTLSVTGSTRRHTDRFTLIRDKPSVYENLHTSWQSTGEFVARRDFFPFTLATGADFSNAQLTSARLGSRAEWRGAAFAELSGGDETHRMVVAGLRADRSDVYGGFVSPSLALSFPLGNDVRVRASGSRGFRAPTWTERYYVDPTSKGNANLIPEQFWSGDVGARVGHRGGVMFDISAYARNASNLIDWVRPSGASTAIPWQAANIGDARYRGIEASLAFPEWNGITPAINASGLDFSDSQGKGLAGKYALRPLTRKLGASASYAFSESVRTTVELMDARRANEADYLTGNARFEYRAGRATVTLDITNLSNASWIDASGVGVAGRAVYAGVAWR